MAAPDITDASEDELIHASEDELIQLAIAVSLSECHGERLSLRELDCTWTAGESMTSSRAERSLVTACGRGLDARAITPPGAGGAWGRGAPKTWASISSPRGGAWESPRPSARPPQEPEGDMQTAPNAGGNAGEFQGQVGPDAMQCARFMGTGHGECANEDEAILGVPLCEISANRVVRFRVPLLGNPRRVSGGADLPRGQTGTEQCHGGATAAEAPCEAAAMRREDQSAGRWVVHGYDAMSLARWLLRDERLPLTSHRVTDDDVGRVWEVFMVSARADELNELEGSGELVRDAVTGKLHRAGKSMRLVDADNAGLDCLDWQFFLAEIHRLTYQVTAARNLLQRDRSFGKRGDGQVRMQLLAEMEGKLGSGAYVACQPWSS